MFGKASDLICRKSGLPRVTRALRGVRGVGSPRVHAGGGAAGCVVAVFGVLGAQGGLYLVRESGGGRWRPTMAWKAPARAGRSLPESPA